MDINSSYLDNLTTQAANNAATSAVGKLSDSKLEGADSYEELESATKQFEAYFLEQIMKSMKQSIDDINPDEDEDSGMNTMKDTYLEQTLGQLSEQMIDQYGGRITRDMTNQMARMYHIEIPEDKK